MPHIKSVVLVVGILAAAGTALTAQSLSESFDGVQGAQQTPPPTQQQPPQGPRIPFNIKLDLTITDSFGGAPTKKTVSMLCITNQGGMVRTSGHVGGVEVKLNVDALVRQTFPTGQMHVQLTFEYKPAQAATDQAARGVEQPVRASPFELHESLNFIVQDGKPLLLSQSADPVSDRRVTVELTATVLK